MVQVSIKFATAGSYTDACPIRPSPGLLKPQIHRRSRRAHAQPQEHRSHAADRQADHRHRRQRIGKVVARLRHDLRRRAAALRRVAVGLRPAVPRADGEAGRRSHRRHLAGDRHPPEEQHPQSALDRRHDDRDPRLHAAAVRARRAARSAGTAARKSCARRPRSSRGSSASLPPGTRLLIGFDLPVVDASVSSGDAPEVDELARSDDEAATPRRRADRDASAVRSATDGVSGERDRRRRIASLRRKGFGRLLVDGQAVAFDDIDPASLRGRADAAGRRRSRAARAAKICVSG